MQEGKRGKMGKMVGSGVRGRESESVCEWGKCVIIMKYCVTNIYIMMHSESQ